jgi:hypothetical protein
MLTIVLYAILIVAAIPCILLIVIGVPLIACQALRHIYLDLKNKWKK